MLKESNSDQIGIKKCYASLDGSAIHIEGSLN